MSIIQRAAGFIRLAFMFASIVALQINSRAEEGNAEKGSLSAARDRIHSIPSSPNSDKTKPVGGEPLLWHKVAAGGSVERVKKLDPKKELPVVATALETRGGKKIARPIRALDVKVFRGSEVYFAELADRVRDGVMYVNIIFSGTPGTTPDVGTVVNIDGASVGFQLTPAHGGGPIRANVMVADVSSEGAVYWRTSKWSVAVDPESELSVPCQFCIGLDSKKNTWSLYADDILIEDDLPLIIDSETPPYISIRAGVAETDKARLLKFRLSRKPEGRSDRYLPAKKGVIDIPKAVAEGDPRLRRPGEIPFMATPTKPSGEPRGNSSK